MENVEKVNCVGIFYKDVEDMFLLWFCMVCNVELDSVEERFFCDFLLSYLCFSILLWSYLVLMDEEEDFLVLKYEIVFSWVYGSRYGWKIGNWLLFSM